MSEETNVNETNNLLGDQPAETEAVQTQTTETTEGDQTQTYDWLPEKFKTPEDLAKSYNELEKKLADVPKAPKEYNWDFTNDMELVVSQDETTRKEAEDMFKHLNMSQSQVEGIVQLYRDQLDAIDQQYQKQMPPRADLEQENATLKQQWGTEYDTRLAAVKKYASTLPPHVLTMPLADTADGLNLLYSMMNEGKTPNPINNTNVSKTTTDLDIREQIRTLRKDERMALPQGDAIGDQARAELYRLYEKLSQLGG